jgi:hypothetical protein
MKKESTLRKRTSGFSLWLSFWLPVCLVFVFGIGITSCSEDEEAAKYTVTISVAYPSGYDSIASNMLVKVTNTQTLKIDSAYTDTAGVASFHLPAGIYGVSTVGETDDFAFNGTLENVTVSAAANFSITLNAVSLEGGLVFKEIYYSGSKTTAGGSYYSDQFQEIYNNSDEVIYLDNLCIGCLTPSLSSSLSVWADAEGNLPSYVPLQFYIWYIAGSGTDYPLQPRTSIVIAQDGIDHQTDSLGNSNSPVNLGNADFEYYCGNINSGKDADAAAVPNMTLMYATSITAYDALFPVAGPALVLFRLPTGVDPVTFASDATNLSTAPGSTSSTKYLLIPKEYVIDAVEGVQADESKRIKRLPSDLDAGYTYCSSTYNSKSVRRKVKQIVGGKVIYKDTNNSTEDFLMDQTPTPFIQPSSVD